jgi:outer membrane protein assembly factor BamB
MNRLHRIIAAIAIGLLGASAVAADWTRFRGPDGTGVVEGKFASDISERDFAWKVQLPGKGHASPVIWKGRIYITSADPDDGKQIVVCLNAKDGSVIWKRDFGFVAGRKHAENSFASATPAVDDVGLYIVLDSPDHYMILGLNHEGKEIWRQDLGQSKSQHGHGASPIVIGDAVILCDDQEGPKSAVVAFDRKTGAPKWKIERPSTDKTSMSTPAVWRPAGGPAQVITSTKGYGFTSIDPATGQVNWEAKVLDARAVGSPVMTNDLIIGACGDGTNYKHIYAVRPGRGGAEPEKVYDFKDNATYVPTPLVKGNRLYLWNEAGILTCADVKTGKPIWTERVGGMYFGSPVCVGDTIWIMSNRGELIGVAAADEYKQTAKINLGEMTHATPSVADGRMYLRTVSHLICVTLREK